MDQTWRQPIRPRRLSPSVAGLAAIAFALVVIFAAVEWSTDHRIQSLDGGQGVGVAPRLSELVGRSQTIFIGTVTSIRGPETLLPAAPAHERPEVQAYRVLFAVQRVLKGESGPTVMATDVVSRGTPGFAAESGRDYLLFAIRGVIGAKDGPVRLVPFGDADGVFALEDGGTATTDRGRRVDVGELERRLSH